MTSILTTLLIMVMAMVCAISTKLKWLTGKKAWIICGCIELMFVAGLFAGAIFDIETLGMISVVSMFIWLLPCAFITKIGMDNDEMPKGIK